MSYSTADAERGRKGSGARIRTDFSKERQERDLLVCVAIDVECT